MARALCLCAPPRASTATRLRNNVTPRSIPISAAVGSYSPVQATCAVAIVPRSRSRRRPFSRLLRKRFAEHYFNECRRPLRRTAADVSRVIYTRVTTSFDAPALAVVVSETTTVDGRFQLAFSR